MAKVSNGNKVTFGKRKTGTYQNAPIDFNGYAVEKGLSPKAGAGIWMKYTIDVNKQLLYNFQFAE